MDREIEPTVRRRRMLRRGIGVVVGIAAMTFLVAASVEWLRPSLRRSEVRLARVQRGDVESTLQASGTVIPLVEQVVSSPVEARVLRIDRRAGDRVAAGDGLLTLDTAGAKLDADRLAEQLQRKESASTELRLQLEERIASLRAQIDQKRLDIEILHYSADQKSRLRAEGLIAEQDALSAAALAKKSDIEMRQLEDALARAIHSRDVQLASSSAEVGLARRERDESRRQLDLAMMRADRAGSVTWIVPEVGTTVRRGDILARIADLSAYRVVATISDVHASRVAAGMPAHLRFDGEQIDGIVESVDPRIDNGVVRFYVTLAQPSHQRLRNNLRVEVSVVTGRRARTLVVHRGALGRSDSTHAYFVRGDRARRLPIRFGVIGDDVVEVVDGAAEGDELVVSDMSDFQGIEELRIR